MKVHATPIGSMGLVYLPTFTIKFNWQNVLRSLWIVHIIDLPNYSNPTQLFSYLSFTLRWFSTEPYLWQKGYRTKSTVNEALIVWYMHESIHSSYRYVHMYWHGCVLTMGFSYPFNEPWSVVSDSKRSRDISISQKWSDAGPGNTRGATAQVWGVNQKHVHPEKDRIPVLFFRGHSLVLGTCTPSEQARVEVFRKVWCC